VQQTPSNDAERGAEPSDPTPRPSAIANGLLTRLLRQVSRSFYLTLRVLPTEVRRPIGLAYLLARTTDTIADTDVLPVADRLTSLSELRRRIADPAVHPVEKPLLNADPVESAERELLSHVEEALQLLQTMDAGDAADIRAVLDIITRGQELDLQRFGNVPPGDVRALQTDDELDDYTWRVAGCVGRFWTRICRRHLFAELAFDDEAMIRDGVRLGKGLQLINILRDLAVDLQQGRCYLPQTRLRDAGLAPPDLLAPNAESRIRPVYDHFINLAEEHLASGWRYTNALPRSQRRVRLACAWPILIGMATIKKLRSSAVLNPSIQVKISRPQVYGILLRSICLLPNPKRWAQQFDTCRAKV
jgi:farnesyl-diphosphate farnesyltransferase